MYTIRDHSLHCWVSSIFNVSVEQEKELYMDERKLNGQFISNYTQKKLHPGCKDGEIFFKIVFSALRMLCRC